MNTQPQRFHDALRSTGMIAILRGVRNAEAEALGAAH